MENKGFYNLKLKKKRLEIKERPYKLLDIMSDNFTVPSIVYISGLATMKDIVKYIYQYGEDSDKFRVDILGEFPKSSGDFLAMREEIEARMNSKYPDVLSTDLQFSIDPSTGGAESATGMAYRNGEHLLGLEENMTRTNEQKEAEFVRFFEEVPKPSGTSIWNVPILIDRSGIGYGFYDYMKTRGYNVDGFNGVETPIDFHNQEKYSNRRTEAFFELLSRIKREGTFLLKDKSLFLLSAMPWTTDRVGKIILKKKDDIRVADKDRHDLDKLDAVSMAYAPTLKKNNTFFGNIRGQFKDNIRELWRRR